MIMARKVAAPAGATVLAVSAPAAKLSSEPTFVFLRPETSSFWNTATNSTMTLPIDYPSGATKALYSGKSQTIANVNELAWNEQNAGSATHVVGEKAPNAYGLYDMLGNVSEFVHDIKVPNVTFIYSGGSGSGSSEQDPMVDPLGSDDAAAVYTNAWNRVERGGSWNNADGYWNDCRAGSACNFYQWTWAGSYVGARFVCPAGAQWSAH